MKKRAAILSGKQRPWP